MSRPPGSLPSPTQLLDDSEADASPPHPPVMAPHPAHFDDDDDVWDPQLDAVPPTQPTAEDGVAGTTTQQPPPPPPASLLPDSQAGAAVDAAAAAAVIPATAEEEDEELAREVVPPAAAAREEARAARQPSPPAAKRPRRATRRTSAPPPPPPRGHIVLRLAKALERDRRALTRSAASFGASVLPASSRPSAPFSHFVTPPRGGGPASPSGAQAGGSDRSLAWLLTVAGGRAAVTPGWVAASAGAGRAVGERKFSVGGGPPLRRRGGLLLTGRTVIFARSLLQGEKDGGAGLRAVAAAAGGAVVVVGASGGASAAPAGAVCVTDGRPGWVDKHCAGALVLDRAGFVEAVVRGELPG